MKIAAVSCRQGGSAKTAGGLSKNGRPAARKADKALKAFKGIWAERTANIGTVSIQNSRPPVFLPKDALLINDIASRYPNQDCLISAGDGRPYCEILVREKPPAVDIYESDKSGNIKGMLVPSCRGNDAEYPFISLVLNKTRKVNQFIAAPSSVSLNPSLPYTIKACYELHKRIMDSKYKVLDVVGSVDGVSFGEESLLEKALRMTAETEQALVRYLAECACDAVLDPASAKQTYESLFPKVQERLELKRNIDLRTPAAKQPLISADNITSEKLDICEMAEKKYPNPQNNEKRIKQIETFIDEKGYLFTMPDN